MIQQTIQEVKFEEIILSKMQRQARKTNKLRHWLEYLNMLDQNKDNDKKNTVIKQMHTMFILREDFWMRELKRVLNDSVTLNAQSFEFAFMALEDGFYLQAAHFIAQKLFEAYISEKIRINFVIAKLEILISQFDFFTKQCAFFYDTLLKVYLKNKNDKKIRQTYQRQISSGFDDYDVTYTQYIKWQESQLKISSINQTSLLQKGKQNWERNRIFIEDELPKIEISQDFFDRQEVKNNQKNIKKCLFYLEGLNTARINEKLYMKLLGLLSVQKQKLWHLRRLVFAETHELVEQYFVALQLSQTDEEEIISSFKVSLNWPNGQTYEMPYLNFLIRRINKHVLKPQSEEYNSQWGSKVEYFRNQISSLIEKQRLNTVQQKQFLHRYYNLWIEVQMALVKDKATVEQLFQSLLNWGQNEEIYIQYAKAMVTLGDVPKAKWILNKTFETYGAQGKAAKQYQKFISLYGTLSEIIKLKKYVQSQNSQAPKETLKIVANQLNHKQIHKETKSKQISQKSVQTKSTIQSLSNAETAEEKLKTHIQQTSLKRSVPVEDNYHEAESHAQKKKIHLDSHNTLFSNKVKKNWGEADIMINLIFKQNVNEIRIVQKQKEKICYIEFDNEQSAQKQLNQNKSSLGLAYSRPPSKSDDRTLFLCNLPTQSTNDEIKRIIPKQYAQLIKEIRCKQKNDKQTAYIEFDSQQTRDQVLSQLKRQKIRIGNKSIIALSCSNDHKDSKQKKNKTIFLKNLSFKCRQKDIRSFFQEKGLADIQQIFIPKDQKTNRSKGFAYIQFNTHEVSEKAFQLQKGKLLGRQFTITRSDRAITHHQSEKDFQRYEKEKIEKSISKDNKKSNNFFSNIFS